MNGGVSTSCSNYAKFYASAMPVLEDGLSSGHTSDTENNNNNQKNLQQSTVNQGGQCPTSLSGSTSIGGSGGISMLMDMKRISTNHSLNSMNNQTTTASTTTDSNGGVGGVGHHLVATLVASPNNEQAKSQCQTQLQSHPPKTLSLDQSPSNHSKVFKNIDPELDSLYSIGKWFDHIGVTFVIPLTYNIFIYPYLLLGVFHRPDTVQMTPPPPAPAPHRKPNNNGCSSGVVNTNGSLAGGSNDVDLLQPSSKHTPLAAAISSTLQRSSPTSTITGNGIGNGSGKTRSAGSNCSSSANGGMPPPIPERTNLVSAVQRSPSPGPNSPVWLSRHLDGGAGKDLLESGSDNHSKNHSADEEDVDTDLETDRLLGHQRLDDQGYYDENKSWDRKPRSLLSKISPKQQIPSTKTRNGYNALLSSTPELPPPIPPKGQSGLGLGLTLGAGNGGKLLDLVGGMVQRSLSRSSSEHSEKSLSKMPISGGDLCAGGVDVVASTVAATSATVVASTPALGSPGNGGGSERSAAEMANPGGAVKLSEQEIGTINGGSVMPLGSGSGTGSGAGSGAGSGTGTNAAVVANSNANNNVGGGGGGGNNSSGSGAGSNSNSGEKKVKKSKSKEGKCVGFILRLIVPIYNQITIYPYIHMHIYTIYIYIYILLWPAMLSVCIRCCRCQLSQTTKR